MPISKIRAVKLERVITTTQSRPVQFLCDDDSTYFCKLNPNEIKRKMIGAVLARMWEIPTPDIAFVNAATQLLRGTVWGEKMAKADIWLFGSQVAPQVVVEFNQSALAQLAGNESLQLLEDALTIGLFDLWLCNEDRTPNNQNLLLGEWGNSNKRLIAIDHAMIFSSGQEDNGRNLSPMTDDDSILSASWLDPLVEKHRDEMENLKGRALEKMERCAERLDGIIPPLLQELSLIDSRFVDLSPWVIQQLKDPKRLGEIKDIFDQLIRK